MDWGKIVLILYIAIFIVMLIMKEEDQEDFIYSASIPIGLPIIGGYDTIGMNNCTQDVIGVTIQIKDTSDECTYNFDKKYKSFVNNARVETEDGVVLLDMIPSDKSNSEELCLSSTDRRYIRNQQTYLVYNKNNTEYKIPLKKIKIKPDPK